MISKSRTPKRIVADPLAFLIVGHIITVGDGAVASFFTEGDTKLAKLYQVTQPGILTSY